MEFHLIVVSIVLKKCVKGYGDSSGQLFQLKKDLISMY